MSRRIFILDPGTASPVGHHYNLCHSLYQEFERRSLPSKIYVHRSFNVASPPFPAVPWFRATPYVSTSDDPLCGHIETFLAVGRILAEDLFRLPEKLTAGDVVILPSVHQVQLLGIAEWLGGQSRENGPAIAVIMGFQSGITYDVAGNRVLDGRVAPLYRMGFRRLLQHDYPRLTIATGPERLAEELSLLATRRVGIHPLTIHAPDIPIRMAAQGPLRLMYVGDARPDKGFAFMPEVAEAVLAKHASVEMVVQASGFLDTFGYGGVVERLEVLAQGGRLGLVRGFQTREDFYRLFADSSAILQPYLATQCASIYSGIFTEAMYFAKPVVVPANTLMAQTVERYGCGVTFDRHAADSVTAAIERLLDNFEEYRQAAVTASADWRARHGTARFVDYLMVASPG